MKRCNSINQLIITGTGTGCHDGSGGSSCCKTSNKCGEGEGDCDKDSHCQANLICGKDNCNAALGFPSSYDCCYDPNTGNFAIITLNKKGGWLTQLINKIQDYFIIAWH